MSQHSSSTWLDSPCVQARPSYLDKVSLHQHLSSARATDTYSHMTASQCNETSYTTPMGLHFNVYCGSNILGYDIRSAPGSNLEDCMFQCSLGQAPRGQGPCQAVSYNLNTSTCWFKDGNATAQKLRVDNVINTGVANPSQFQPLDLACPFRDQSLQNVSNGMTFEINCRKDALGSDFDWTIDQYYEPQHVETLEECMSICSEGHPLCYGVVFNPDLQRGYHNCYPKSANMSQKLTNSPWVMHTALAQISYNTTCSSGTYIATTSDKAFDRLCDQTADGEDIGQIYMPNFSACMDYCSTYTNGSKSCSAAVYQPTAADQFENCYLKSSAQYIYSRTGYNLATVASSRVNNTNTSNNPSNAGNGGVSVSTSTPSNNKSNSSKAWIAGAVIGPLAAIAFLIVVILYWRRRHNTRDRASQTKITEVPYHNGPNTALYSAVQPGSSGPSEVDGSNVRRSELTPNTRSHELP